MPADGDAILLFEWKVISSWLIPRSNCFGLQSEVLPLPRVRESTSGLNVWPNTVHSLQALSSSRIVKATTTTTLIDPLKMQDHPMLEEVVRFVEHEPVSPLSVTFNAAHPRPLTPSANETLNSCRESAPHHPLAERYSRLFTLAVSAIQAILDLTLDDS